MITQDIILQRGDDWVFQAEVKRSNNTRRSVAGWTFYFSIKRNSADPEAASLVRLVIQDTDGALNGQAASIVPATDLPEPGTYSWRCRVKTAENFTTTLGAGRFIIQ